MHRAARLQNNQGETRFECDQRRQKRGTRQHHDSDRCLTANLPATCHARLHGASLVTNRRSKSRSRSRSRLQRRASVISKYICLCSLIHVSVVDRPDSHGSCSPLPPQAFKALRRPSVTIIVVKITHHPLDHLSIVYKAK